MDRKLFLLRHAKSSWNNNTLSDFDRPLNKRGVRDAPVMAQRLLARGCSPDKVLCSPSTRTRETAAHYVRELNIDEHRVEYIDAIYEASPGDLVTAIESQLDMTTQLMLIGHNPAMEYLASMLNQGERLTMATSAVCEFDVRGIDSWRDVSQAEIQLAYFDFPKNG